MADKNSYMTWMSNLTNDIILSEAVIGTGQSNSYSSDNYNPSADGDSDEFIYETLDACSIELPLFKETHDSTAPEIKNDGNALYAMLGSGHEISATFQQESTENKQISENEFVDWTKLEAHDDYSTPSGPVQSALNGKLRSAEELNVATDINFIASTLDDRKPLIEKSINFDPSTNYNGHGYEQKRIGEDADLPAFDDGSLTANESSTIISASTSAARNGGAASTLLHSAITAPAMGTRSALTTSSTNEPRSNGGQALYSKFSEVNFSGSWYPSSTPVILGGSGLPRHTVGRETSFSSSGIMDSPLSIMGATSSIYERPLQRQLSSDPFLCSPDTMVLNADPSLSPATSKSVPTRQYPSRPPTSESVDLSSITFQVIQLTSSAFTSLPSFPLFCLNRHLSLAQLTIPLKSSPIFSDFVIVRILS